jgi:TetR/AcrR family transcriptional regulator
MKAAAPFRKPAAKSGAGRPKKAAEAPADRRAEILQAALTEFAEEGMAGARTEAIAKRAGVNIALLFYYFKNKEQLYGAVLDDVFHTWSDKVRIVLESGAPSEKLLAYAGTHFDHIASFPARSRLVQQEMMRSGRTGSPHIERLAKRYIQPVHSQLRHIVQQGVACGEFRAVDPQQFIYSMTAMIVFYFTSYPVISVLTDGDPLSPARVACRRAAVLDFVRRVLFVDPEKEIVQ